MYHPLQNKLFHLLAVLTSAYAGKESSSNTKVFKFKDDLHIKFEPLTTAISPTGSSDTLLSALDSFAEQFRDIWIEQIEDTLQGGKCTVNEMSLPEFSLCDWRFPEYDADELPTPGQCYEYENGFIQRIYYKIKTLDITCPEYFSYDDLAKDTYLEAAFASNTFLDIISQKPVDTNCDEEDDSSCLFAKTATAELSSSDECTALLYITRFVDIPLVLKCLDYEYGTKVANRLIKAVDMFFEEKVRPFLTEQIYEQVPEAFVYNFVSPYESDRKYCSHGSWYKGGSLVDQSVDEDGIILTKFILGFDTIWYRPIGYKDELFQDEDMSLIIASAFEDGDFLGFLQDNFPAFIQDDVDGCIAIDPRQADLTFAPSTSRPSRFPSSSPIVITPEPTLTPTTNLPTTMSPTVSHMPSYIIEPSFEPTSTSFPSEVPTSTPTLSPTGGSTDAGKEYDDICLLGGSAFYPISQIAMPISVYSYIAGNDKTISPTPFPKRLHYLPRRLG